MSSQNSTPATRLTNNELALATEYAFQYKQLPSRAVASIRTNHDSQRSTEPSLKSDTRVATMPIIPPRLTQAITATSVSAHSEDQRQSWYCVISPRETNGLAGPFSVLQLKQMFRSTVIGDQTLVWREGEGNEWTQLVNQHWLRSQLIQLPAVPPRMGSYNEERAVFDPVVSLPDASLRQQAKHFLQVDTSRSCSFCGGLAVKHMPQTGEALPDLYKCREEVGTTEFASEVLPGFLWVGSAPATKHRSILTLGLTLLINCTEEEKSPREQLPFFRCKELSLPNKDMLAMTAKFGTKYVPNVHSGQLLHHRPPVPLTESERSLEHTRQQRLILDSFERAFDFIEWERLHSDRNTAADLPMEPYRGPVDECGQPSAAHRKRPFRRPDRSDPEASPAFPPRVLLWSATGTDRACAVCCAYLIKYYGLSLARAMEIMRLNRPVMSLSQPLLTALQRWAEQYSTGLFLCIDCANSADQETLLRELDEEVRAQEEDILSGLTAEEQMTRSVQRSEQRRSDALAQRRANASALDQLSPQDIRSHRQFAQLEFLLQTHLPKVLRNFQQLTSGVNTQTAFTKSTAVGVDTGTTNTSQNGLLREIDLLSRSSDYLSRVSMNAFDANAQLQWARLIDLNLSHCMLSDATLACLFQCMDSTYLRILRRCDLRGNRAGAACMRALLLALYPKRHVSDPDDDRYLLDSDKPILAFGKNESAADSSTAVAGGESVTSSPRDMTESSSQVYSGTSTSLVEDPTGQLYSTHSELTQLDLSNNALRDENSARYLSLLLLQCDSLTSLNISHNQMPDEPLSTVLATMISPLPSFAARNFQSSFREDTMSSRSRQSSVRQHQPSQAFKDSVSHQLSALKQARHDAQHKDNAPQDFVSPFLDRDDSDEDEFQASAAHGNGKGRRSAATTSLAQHSELVSGERFNSSITHLDVSKNTFGEHATATLTRLLKQNVVLTRLHIELCPHITARQWKRIANAIRVYNTTLQSLSINSAPLTVATCGHIARICQPPPPTTSSLAQSMFSSLSLSTPMSSPSQQLRILSLQNCQLKAKHMETLRDSLIYATSLTALDVSHNLHIGRRGCFALAAIVSPPLLLEDARLVTQTQQDAQYAAKCLAKAQETDKTKDMFALEERMRLQQAKKAQEKEAYQRLYEDTAPLRISLGDYESKSTTTKPEKSMNLPPIQTLTGPPLQQLDVSSCGVDGEGMSLLMKAIARKTTLSRVDLSHNIIGCDNTSFFECFQRAYALDEIHLDYCHLQSTGVDVVFRLLTPCADDLSTKNTTADVAVTSTGLTPRAPVDTSTHSSKKVFNAMRESNTSLGEGTSIPAAMDTTNATAAAGVTPISIPIQSLPSTADVSATTPRATPTQSIASTLRCLTVCGNDVSDSSARALSLLLRHNVVLETLDLGFNKLTNACARTLRESVKVTSAAAIERKVKELHVNLIGNDCDPYMLEMPGMARAKIHFQLGMEANQSNDDMLGYNHIEHRARGKFLVQKDLYDRYRHQFPAKPINAVR